VNRTAPDARAILDIGLNLMAQGFRPVLVYPPGFQRKTGPTTGKEPFGEAWGLKPITEATLREDVRYFVKRRVTPGWGVCLGSGRAPGEGWLADIEGDGPDAEASRLKLFGGAPPETMGWPSARGHHQLIVIRDEARFRAIVSSLKAFESKDAAQIGVFHIDHALPGLELRLGGYKADGTIKQVQSVVPPTPGTDGKPRVWNGKSLADAPEAFYRVLEAVADEVKAKKPKGRVGAASRSKPRPDDGPVRLYALAALDAEVSALASAKEGTRNATLNGAAFVLGQLVGADALKRPEVEHALIDAAKRSGLSEGEIGPTLRSGLDTGIGQPRDLSEVGKASNGCATITWPGVDGKPATDGDGEAGGGAEAIDDPHRLARVYCNEHCQCHDELTNQNQLTLRYHQGEFLWWDSAYRPRDEKDLRADLTNAVKAEFDRIAHAQTMAWRRRGEKDIDGKPCLPPKPCKVSTSLISNVMQALGGYTRLAADTASPAWLIDGPPFPAEGVLPTHNALVHLPSLVAGLDAIRPPTPLFFGRYALDYDFQLNSPEPVEWLTFLGARPVTSTSKVKLQLWPDDPESIQTLQEWFGYFLEPDTSQQKILMLIGPRRCGKGTIARIIRGMIGAGNVVNPTLSSLGANFGLAPMIGKPVAIITDARLSGRTDIAATVERLLSISGEDGLTIDRKYLPDWSGTLPTRFVVISNELPWLAETSGALAGRMIVLKMTRSFFGQEDRTLTSVLMGELPGILLWAIEGWRRLKERGYFVQPQSGAPLVELLEDLSSPAGMFVRECCAVGPEYRVSVATLFARWRGWCAVKNREHPGDEATFGRNLRAVLPRLETKPVRRNGKWERDFVGIGVKPEESQDDRAY
jgi:putative DNA primase/helicase